MSSEERLENTSGILNYGSLKFIVKLLNLCSGPPNLGSRPPSPTPDSTSASSLNLNTFIDFGGC